MPLNCCKLISAILINWFELLLVLDELYHLPFAFQSSELQITLLNFNLVLQLLFSFAGPVDLLVLDYDGLAVSDKFFPLFDLIW